MVQTQFWFGKYLTPPPSDSRPVGAVSDVGPLQIADGEGKVAGGDTAIGVGGGIGICVVGGGATGQLHGAAVGFVTETQPAGARVTPGAETRPIA